MKSTEGDSITNQGGRGVLQNRLNASSSNSLGKTRNIGQFAWLLCHFHLFLDWNCYSYGWIIFKCFQYWNFSRIDSEEDSGRFGRLINHDPGPGVNIRPVVLEDDEGRPHLIFVAVKDIAKGQQLFYDYGETDPKALEQYPWLKQRTFVFIIVSIMFKTCF